MEVEDERSDLLVKRARAAPPACKAAAPSRLPIIAFEISIADLNVEKMPPIAEMSRIPVAPPLIG
jgi:hypothetical protein